eukprot:TRINITY_DN9123_c2_g1_i1.p1 TRINITY_DN9123_c2_g1~~TRINITY_DN9123_c2_g1_i1.p1  ORF type:complete len:322 (-),score=46.87 TRINITY_DN9123_c2_g1_i1:300-1265(-)
MRVSATLLPMVLSYLAARAIEALRSNDKAQKAPPFRRFRDCALGAEKPKLFETYQCVRFRGEEITREVDGKEVVLKKFCRVSGKRLNNQRFARKLDAITSLVMSRATASGITKTEEELRTRINSAKVNIWIEEPGGEIVSHSAFYDDNAALDANCPVGEIGSLVVAPGWQGKQLAKESDVIVDITYDLDYKAFYTTTKVTNLESLKTQRRDDPAFQLKRMGTIFGYLQAQHDLGETQPKGTVAVAMMSPTGGWYSCLHHRLSRKLVNRCGPVVMGRFVQSGKYAQVNFTKDDLFHQVELDPETPKRAVRVLTGLLGTVLDL